MMGVGEQSYRYWLLDVARGLYRDAGLDVSLRGLSRCCTRHNPLSGGFFGLSIVGGSVVLRGRNHCHNRACCPVCSYPRQMRTMSDVCHGIWNARHKGHGVYLVTLTFSHGSGDEFGVIQHLLSVARQRMYRQGGFRSWLRSAGYVGRVVDYEVQLMGRNGPHPHTHELFFGDSSLDLWELEEVYDKYWISSLYEAGLSGRVGVRCKVTGYEGVGDYITKMGSEVCLSNFSKDSWGGGSMSPLRVLARYADTGDGLCADAWLDYVLNIRGKRIIGFSRGLRGYLGIGDWDDGDSGDGPYDADLLSVRLDDVRRLSMAEWADLCADVDGGGLDRVLSYLDDIRVSYDVIGGGLNLYRAVLDCRKGGDVEDLVNMVKNKKG